MKNFYLVLMTIACFICMSLYSDGVKAQELRTQTIRGTVSDKTSQLPIEAVEITVRENRKLKNPEVYTGVTNAEGEFRIKNVPVGRYRIEFHYLGYATAVRNNVVVTSAREVVLHVGMKPSSQELNEITITSGREGEALNEMAMVSAREFSVLETKRYAGSRGEPARMAANFAGVQGADDSRNDIIIRGNAPSGVLWRLEGINIPNPNHFSIPGTTGGPVTILNNVYLANSDFYTGAFPAEFGNALAGVFDLRMRNGNNEQHEFSAKLGFLGTEVKAEGPIDKSSGSSYLATYRYSTLALFQFMNIKIGTDAIPRYQDGAFRLNFPLSKKVNLAVFGIGGVSDIDIVLSDQEKPDKETLIYGSNDRDQYFGSQMGVVGVTLSHSINKNTFMETAIAASNHSVHSDHTKIIRHVENGYYVYDSIPKILEYNFINNRYTLTSYLKNRLSESFELKSGIIGELYQHNFIDSARAVTVVDSLYKFQPWKTRWNSNDYSFLLQLYSEFKWTLNSDLKVTGGLMLVNQFLGGEVNTSLEPRAGMSYSLNNRMSIDAGIGLHSQVQPYYLYYYLNSDNLDMGLSKSLHFVLGYNYRITPSLRIKTEAYFQHLFNIPVDKEPSSFSLVNAGSGFSRLFPGNLVNEGIGRNYGIEFTLEKFFSNQYYFLVTASLFDSKYQGSDGIWRNTTYNGQFALNGLFGYEFILTPNLNLSLGAKATFIGGRWYGDVDKEASARVQEIVFEDDTRNSKQFKPYFRVDTKVGLRWNQEKVTHEISLDLINIFNIRNILALTYAPNHPSGNPIRKEYQLGFLPIFYYKIDF